MSSNIDPIQPEFRPQTSARVQPPNPGVGDAFGIALSRAQAVKPADPVEEIGATPPPHLADNIAAAARAWNSLAVSGRHVSFEQGPDGKLTIELQDENGNKLDGVAPSALFDLIDSEADA
jgi:hypothetical protein